MNNETKQEIIGIRQALEKELVSKKTGEINVAYKQVLKKLDVILSARGVTNEQTNGQVGESNSSL